MVVNFQLDGFTKGKLGNKRIKEKLEVQWPSLEGLSRTSKSQG